MSHAFGAQSASPSWRASARSSSGATLAVASARLPFIDFARGVAALVIVGHHLSFYGPLSDVAYPLAPTVFDWLSSHGRLAVRVFLLIGGFGMARRIARLPALGVRSFAGELWGRYRRIGLPYLAALVLAVACNELARLWMEHPSISGPPGLAQFAAHAVFLAQILGYESLTAGAWYPAIDFQLVALSLALFWLCQTLTKRGGIPNAEDAERLFALLGGGLAIGSFYWLSRQRDLDVWAIYFFGSYYLGMLIERSLRNRVPRIITSWPRNRLALGLGKISYSLFLVHFPVCLVVNAWCTRFLYRSPHAALCGMLAAAALSVAAAVAFHRFVEVRCHPSRATNV